MDNVKERFKDYVGTMYPHIREAYANPPYLVQVQTPLHDCVTENIPPDYIGEHWLDIAKGIYMNCIKWSTEKPIPERIFPTIGDMHWYIDEFWQWK